MNGIQADNAIRLRPKRSANGPTIIDPIGKQMVTILAEKDHRSTKLFPLSFFFFGGFLTKRI